MQRAQQILHVQYADDILWIATPHRQTRHRRRDYCVNDVLRRIVGIERHHVGAVNHHVRNRKLAQIEHTAEHVTVKLLHVTFAVEEINSTA
jgi:hypothetical protein